MFNVNDYLSKFKNIGIKQVLEKECILKILKEILFIDLDPKSLSIKDNSIKIKADPALKSEIMIKKAKILDLLKKNLPDSKIKDII